MKMVDVTGFERFSPIFRGEKGHRRAEFIMHLLAIDKVNQVYENSERYMDAVFASHLLKDLGVNYLVGNADRLQHLPGEGFITISNHPYGGLDGIILIDLMAAVRRDYKFMVNKILSMVKTMQGAFISVTPAGNKKNAISAESIAGIRETLSHLRAGHPVGFFPSGAVSDFSLRDFRVRDREWQKSIISLIKFARVPVLPVRFFDLNSPFFYSLGLINWRIRLLRMPGELFNKSRQNPRIGIGRLITVEEQDQYAEPGIFSRFLRNAVYEMPLPGSFVARTDLNINF